MNLSDTQIKNGWKIVGLGDVSELTSSKRIYLSDYVSSGVPFYRSKEIINLSLGADISDVLYITGEKFNEIKNRFGTPKIGDLLITSVGTLGVVYRVKDENFYFKDGNLIWFRNFKEEVNSEYILYSLKSEDTQNRLMGIAIGSSQKAFTISALKNFKILLPSLDVQNNITKFISTYDYLIENNNKRIKILESMAQKLYTEWFVKFKFPGHEKVKMVDSGSPDFGMIPEGWCILKILDIGKVVTGKTPPTSNQEFYGGETLFIKTPDIHGNIFITDSIQTLSSKGVENQKSKTLPPKTVFVSCIGTIGSVGITSKNSQTNQQINAIVLKNNNDYVYLYIFLSSLKEMLVNLGSNGATMGNVNKDKFENINLLYPERKIMDSFFEHSKDVFDEILNLQKQNINLKKSRDILIPQLVSSKIDL